MIKQFGVQELIFTFMLMHHGHLKKFNRLCRKYFKPIIRISRRYKLQYTNLLVFRYLIENLDVNRFGSSYTVYNAKDASVIIDTTSSISTFYTAWNNSNYQNHPVGLDLSLVFRHIHDASKLTLDQEQSNSSVGGRSHIALIIPQMSSPNDANGNDATERLLLMREEVPDLVLLFLAGGAASRFERFARERRDIFAFQSISSEKENVPATVNPVIRRIQEGKANIIFRMHPFHKHFHIHSSKTYY